MTITDRFSLTNNIMKEYIRKVKNLVDSESATEESFYHSLHYLLKNYFKTQKFEVIIVPKSDRIIDKPDFIIYMDNIPIISIEAKNPFNPIDQWLKANTNNRLFQQVYKYRGAEKNNIPVLITDFIHIWVIDKDSPNTLDKDHVVKYKFQLIDYNGAIWKTHTGAVTNFEKALSYLCDDIIFSISKISALIEHLVKYAKKLKLEVIEVFKDSSNPMNRFLGSIRDDFINSIFSKDKEQKSKEFADLFSQTIIYGGFLAWMSYCKDGNDPKQFSFNDANRYLSYGTFTHQLFANLSINITPKIHNEIIAKIETIFQATEFDKISKSTETLMITFYSDFLRKYDPVMAKNRGIVFTPHPIIKFITKAIDYFLRKYFEKEKGLASNDVFILDPAAGTMGFPCEVLRQVKQNYEKEYQLQPSRIITEYNEWIHNSFLKNVYAFELLMAPYVLGHLRTNMLINELGGKFDPTTNRVKLFLFNTLMDMQTKLDDFRNKMIGEELVNALHIRNKESILVVMGNPPYNVSSQNKFDWIETKINYNVDKSEIKHFIQTHKKLKLKTVDVILEIKKSKNDYLWDLQREGTKDVTGFKAIQDDYVKFIRFAQWKVKQNGEGIVAYITNNYYIDGPIFRGMRSSLRKDFDKIYVLDLFGDARKELPLSVKEKGIITDENVFGIKPGVAIIFLVRIKEHSDSKCDVYYYGKYGTKQEKFEFLEHSDHLRIFKKIPKRIDYQFCPDKFQLRSKYMTFTYLLDIFDKNVQGIVTGNDEFVSDIDKDVLKKRITNFFDNKISVKTKSMDYEKAKTKTTTEHALSSIILWNYRGFDKRYICYDPALLVRDRFELMQYLFPHQNNLCIFIDKNIRKDLWSHIIVTNCIGEHVVCTDTNGLGSYMFPLFVNYSDTPDNIKKPKPAIDSNIKQDFMKKLPYWNWQELKQEEKINAYRLVFYYIYGILYSTIYRSKYLLGLKEDYPRIPFPNDIKLFTEMCEVGEKLAKLHLFEEKDIHTTQFPMGGSTDYKIYNIKLSDKDNHGNQIPETYDPKTQRIYFKKRTKTQIELELEGNTLREVTWIGGITQEMWDFNIGGVQQLKNWLYNRRFSEEIMKKTIQRSLNNDEIEYFLKMCYVIKKTIELRQTIDGIYSKIDN